MEERLVRQHVGLRRLWVRSDQTVPSDDGEFEYTVYLALARFERGGNVKWEAQVRLVPPDGEPPRDEYVPAPERQEHSV